jgi:hypothetical protein
MDTEIATPDNMRDSLSTMGRNRSRKYKKSSKIKHSIESTVLPSFIKKSSSKNKRCPPGTRTKCTCVAKRKLKGKAFSRKRCAKGYHYNKTTGICEPPIRFEKSKDESSNNYDTIMDKFKNL